MEQYDVAVVIAVPTVMQTRCFFPAVAESIINTHCVYPRKDGQASFINFIIAHHLLDFMV